MTLHLGDCLEILPTLPDASVDAVVTDPPYPCIKRDYGMMTEDAWMEMMKEVVRQTRRILKPTGSAVFILQPNSEKVGRMRLWLWKFMVWAGEEWGIVQDAYWWNYTAMPAGGVTKGLMRGSTKPCVWIGNADCYRSSKSVLWSESDWNKCARHNWRIEGQGRSSPSGHIHGKKMSQSVVALGGVSPFNLLPFSNGGRHNRVGHGAGTPLKLADWWIRYICPPGGVVADWFTGSGTMGIAAKQNGCSFVGIEKMPKYYELATKRLAEE